jgi:hypothetical protein
VHCDVIRFVAFDLVLRFIVACMNLVPFELDLGRYHLCNRAADAPGFRVPTHVIANREVLRGLLSGHCLYSYSSVMLFSGPVSEGKLVGDGTF